MRLWGPLYLQRVARCGECHDPEIAVGAVGSVGAGDPHMGDVRAEQVSVVAGGVFPSGDRLGQSRVTCAQIFSAC